MSVNKLHKDDSCNSSLSPFSNHFASPLLHSDSFEIIEDTISMAPKSLNLLRTSVLNPLEDVILRNKQLKELLEKCTKKLCSVNEDQEKMLEKLQVEKNKCSALEEESLRLQVEITSLHQKITAITKERDDVVKQLLPPSPLQNTNLDVPADSKERIKIDAIRKSKMETLAKNLAETKQQLTECQRHLESKDADLSSVHKNTDEMRLQVSLLEESLARERKLKVEKENQLDSVQRSVVQLNAKLSQGASTFDEEIQLINDAHRKELNAITTEYNTKVENMEKINQSLQKTIDVLKQQASAKHTEHQDFGLSMKVAYEKEISVLTDTNNALSKDLSALKLTLQRKETLIAQMEREQKSLIENIDHFKEQIRYYSTDFNAERQSREEMYSDKIKLEEKVKNYEEQFQKIRDNFTTELNSKDSIALENETLKQQFQSCSAELASVKQLKDQLTLENETLKQQAIEKDSQLGMLTTDLNMAKEDNDQMAAHITQLMQQIDTLQQKQAPQVNPLLQYGYTPPTPQGIPPPQQGNYTPPSQQSVQGYPHQLTNVSNDFRPSNLYTPPMQQPIPPEPLSPRRLADTTADTPDVVRYPPSYVHVCPICNRFDFENFKALERHAEFCTENT